IKVGAELGIVLLLFFLGLEFNLERLIANKDRMGKSGVLDLVVNFGAGFVLGFLVFQDLIPALLIAGIVYISSSAVITKTLLDLGWIANPESGPLLGTLVFEDIVIAVYLVIVSALVIGGGSIATIAQSIGLAIGFIVLLLLLVYFGTVIFEYLVQTNFSEFFVLRILGITVLIAGAALVVGVSEAVAAFFVGMAFSSTSRVHDIEEAISPIRDVFAAVFFFWIGLVTDPLLFIRALDLIAVAVLVTLPTKLFTGFYGGRIYNLNNRRSLRVGLAMVTRGEFSLIIGAIALTSVGMTLNETTAQTIYSFAVGYVLVMSILGTVLMQTSGFFESYIEPVL
ncbi:MAG: cation:proton antiporter, partial [Halobacteria archaeon]|nr:cation:proton antiporter [Halobacteria archaeon]